ncbi:MAG: succinate--CoA ligase subunit alpha, partial [Mesorhizobium sp.]
HLKGAARETGADASVVFVPPPFAADSIMEAADAGIKFCACITDGIPSQDMMHGKRYMRRYRFEDRMQLIGPNCAGVITPGQALMGIMPGSIYLPGRARSATRPPSQMNAHGIGVSTSVGIGGDPINGSSFKDILQLFEQDDETGAVVMIGEIGGSAEEDAAQFLKDEAKRGRKKPMAGFIAGRTAPAGRTMGHAGAVISGGKGGAEDKIAAMESAGIKVSPSPARLGTTLVEAIKG